MVEGSPRVNVLPSSSSSTWPEMSNKSNPVSLLPHLVSWGFKCSFYYLRYPDRYLHIPTPFKHFFSAYCPSLIHFSARWTLKHISSVVTSTTWNTRTFKITTQMTFKEHLWPTQKVRRIIKRLWGPRDGRSYSSSTATTIFIRKVSVCLNAVWRHSLVLEQKSCPSFVSYI